MYARTRYSELSFGRLFSELFFRAHSSVFVIACVELIQSVNMLLGFDLSQLLLGAESIFWMAILSIILFLVTLIYNYVKFSILAAFVSGVVVVIGLFVLLLSRLCWVVFTPAYVISVLSVVCNLFLSACVFLIYAVSFPEAEVMAYAISYEAIFMALISFISFGLALWARVYLDHKYNKDGAGN